MRITIFGLAITSSWGNGHATTYRGLVRELAARGHRVLFLERDVPWYAANRDFAAPYVRLYRSLDDLRAFAAEVRAADLVLVGSFVPDGVAMLMTTPTPSGADASTPPVFTCVSSIESVLRPT